MWFKQLFGFEETSWEETKSRLALEGGRLRSLVNGLSYAVGTFTTPTLGMLRERGRAVVRNGRLRLTHEVIDDVLTQHGDPENRGALFQVASQFNCLEFPGPSTVPEDGVTGYADDPTQGPACCLAAAAATVYRNYFVAVAEGEGQTRDNQINNLDRLALELGDPGQFWEVRNGYTFASSQQLAQLSRVLEQHDRQALLAEVKIGLHRDVGVTFLDRFTPAEGDERLVSQAFCSAVSCAYGSVPVEEWAPLATLVLDACYEATLWATAISAAKCRGSNKVWLTLLGEGVFGNETAWIADAMGGALVHLAECDLDVRIAHHRRIHPELVNMIRERVGV